MRINPPDASKAFRELGGSIAVVKAQIHAGGRGKGTVKDNSSVEEATGQSSSKLEFAKAGKLQLGDWPAIDHDPGFARQLQRVRSCRSILGCATLVLGRI